jgi:hypothetical protein
MVSASMLTAHFQALRYRFQADFATAVAFLETFLHHWG